MDQVTVVKSHIHKERWKSLISECQSSGMTVRDWCRANSICEQTYYRNLRRLREEICRSLPVPAAEPEKPVVFSQLEVKAPVPGVQAAVIIHLPSATLEVHNGADRQTVEAVLLALKTIC